MAVAEQVEVLDPAPTLDELRDRANQEHRLGLGDAASMVEHWVASGEALIKARERISGDKAWRVWVAENFEASRSTAGNYMRLANCKQRVEALQPTTLNEALALVASEPRGYHGKVTLRVHDRAEAQRLHSTGQYTYRALAEHFGVSRRTAWGWVNPDRMRQKRLEREQQLRALRDERRAARIREAGGNAAEAFTLLRKALLELQQGHDRASNHEVKSEISTAMYRLYDAIEAIDRAVKLA